MGGWGTKHKPLFELLVSWKGMRHGGLYEAFELPLSVGIVESLLRGFLLEMLKVFILGDFLFLINIELELCVDQCDALVS